MKLLTEVVHDRTHVTEVVRYFAKGLEGSRLTVNEGNGMPTMRNPSNRQRKCRVRWGRTGLHQRKSTINRNKNPKVEGGRAPEGGRVMVASLP